MKTPVISALNAVFLPAKDLANPTNKLMIVLHGLGDSSDGYAWLPSQMGRSDISYLLLNAPDPYISGFSWFDIYENPAPGIIRSRELLFKIVQELEQQNWKTENMCLFGFSQGCFMVLDLALRFPKIFSAIVGISGFIRSTEDYSKVFSPFAKEQKFFVTHGTQDPVLPLPATKKQIQELQALGINIKWKEYEKVHTIDPYQELQDIREFLRTSGF